MSNETCTDPSAIKCSTEPQIITGQSSSEISSPGYPCPYGKNLACVWEIEVDSNNVVGIEFEEFDLQPNTANLTLYNSWNINSSDPQNQLAKFTGDSADGVTSTSNRIAIRFNTDANEHQNKGFKLHYRSITNNSYQPTNPINDNSDDSSRLSTEVIAGIAVGSVVLILALILMGILLHKWMKKKSRVDHRPDDVDHFTVPTRPCSPTFETIRQEVPSMYRSESSGGENSRTSHIFTANVNGFPRLPTYDEATNEDSRPTSRNFGDRMISFGGTEART